MFDKYLDILFRLVRYDIYRLAFFFSYVFIVVQAIEHTVEIIVFGKNFVHIVDLIVVIVLAGLYGYSAYKMGLKINIEFR